MEYGLCQTDPREWRSGLCQTDPSEGRRSVCCLQVSSLWIDVFHFTKLGTSRLEPIGDGDDPDAFIRVRPDKIEMFTLPEAWPDLSTNDAVEFQNEKMRVTLFVLTGLFVFVGLAHIILLFIRCRRTFPRYNRRVFWRVYQPIASSGGTDRCIALLLLIRRKPSLPRTRRTRTRWKQASTSFEIATWTSWIEKTLSSK